MATNADAEFSGTDKLQQDPHIHQPAWLLTKDSTPDTNHVLLLLSIAATCTPLMPVNVAFHPSICCHLAKS